MGFPFGSVIKNPFAMQNTQETWVQSLGQEDPLEKEMATCSLPRKSNGQYSLVGYSPLGLKESDTTERLSTYIKYVCIYFYLSLLFILVGNLFS